MKEQKKQFMFDSINSFLFHTFSFPLAGRKEGVFFCIL